MLKAIAASLMLVVVCACSTTRSAVVPPPPDPIVVTKVVMQPVPEPPVLPEVTLRVFSLTPASTVAEVVGAYFDDVCTLMEMVEQRNAIIESYRKLSEQTKP